MATNCVYESGDRMPHTAAAAVSSGAVVVVGGRVGVALGDIAADEDGILAVSGVYALPKAAEALTQGTPVYWDADGDPVGGEAGTGASTATATDNTPAGYAFADAEATDETVQVKLNG